MQLTPDKYAVKIKDNVVREGSLASDFADTTEPEYIVDVSATKPPDWSDLPYIVPPDVADLL